MIRHSASNGFLGRASMGVAMAALCLLCSCGKESVSAVGPRERVTFVVGVPGDTRSAIQETDVRSLDLLVFRHSDGALDVSKRITGSALTGITAEVASGVDLDWFIIANAPADALSGYVSESAFLAGTTALTDGISSTLVMHDNGSVRVDAANPPAVTARLERYVSKVSLTSVSVEWIDAFATAPVITVGRVALVNVVGTCPWTGMPTVGSVWYNQMGVSSNPGGMLVWNPASAVTVTASAPVSLGAELYAMPNPTDNVVNSLTNPSWSVRDTRVALELVVDGDSNWYPIDLPSMEGNTHYVISGLVVKGPGSDSPDKPVIRSEVSFTVEVLDWGTEELSPVFLTGD